MGVIMKLRQQIGLIVVAIGVAIVSFLAMDALNSNTGVLAGHENLNAVGSVNGREVDIDRFNAEDQMNQRRTLYEQNLYNQNYQFNDQQLAQIRQSTWGRLIEQELLNDEYEKLGIEISDEELRQAIASQNPDPRIRQFWQKIIAPGQPYDAVKMQQTIDQIRQLTPDNPNFPIKEYYVAVTDDIYNSLKRQKLMMLYQKGIYVPDWMVQDDYMLRNRKASIRYIKLPYESVNTMKIEPTEKELQEYMDDHPGEFKTDETRIIEYVTFDITPSSEDSASTMETLMDNFKKFRTTKNDSAFITRRSKSLYYPVYFNKNILSSRPEYGVMTAMADSIFSVPMDSNGAFLGPFLENGRYRVIKVRDRQMMPDSVKLRHIFTYVGPKGNVDSAKAKSDSLFGVLASGQVLFDSLAINNSDDQGSARKGGDLGWLAPSDYRFPVFYKSFRDRIFDQPIAAGDTFRIHTTGGFHIVRVDAVSDSSQVYASVAYLDEEIRAGEATRDDGYRAASKFYTTARGKADDAYDKAIEESGKINRPSTSISKDALNVPGINGNIRPIVQWAYEAEVGEIKMFSPGEIRLDASSTALRQYVVAHLVASQEENEPSLELVREEVRNKVIREKQKAQLRDQFVAAMGGNASMEQIASNVGQTMMASDGITFAAQAIPGGGSDAIAAAAAVGLNEGERSGIIEGNTGVWLIENTGITEAQIPEDLSGFKPQTQQVMMRAQSNKLMQGLMEGAEIIDRRYKFF